MQNFWIPKEIEPRNKMENRVSLSNYFGTDEANDERFFDEIGATGASTDIMTLSVNLQDAEHSEAAQPESGGLFTDAVHTIPATSLPDPATFFDTIPPDLHVSSAAIESKPSPDFLTQSIETLSLKDSQTSTELDRRRDAWIATEDTKKILIKAQSAPPGSFFPDRDCLTTPGIILEEELPDHLHDTAVRLLGVGEASVRPRPLHITKDEAGVKELIRTGYLRAALALTTTLLTALGQGAASLKKPSRHSPRSLQLWLTRFAVMARLRLRTPLAAEAKAFGDLTKPDMFYQFYPETYGKRAGSMAPFSLRLLLAEVPLHAGEPGAALDNVHRLLAVVRKMLSNLRNGRSEDGSAGLDEQERSESIRLWSGRETRLFHSLVNCAVALKDYHLAIGTTSRLAAGATSDAQARALRSALCRLCLRAGHVREAERHLAAAADIRQRTCPTADVREHIDRGLIHAAQGRYAEACVSLGRAAEQDPTDITVANNTAVCLLYSGRLKEAIAVLHKAIALDPERALNDALVLNLCTLYELQSSNTSDHKLGLLKQLCKYKTDTMPDVECLKLS